MPRRTPSSKAIPPLFVLRAGEPCPQCGEGTNVFALLASGLYDGIEVHTFNDFILLKDIEYLPESVLAMLTKRCPGWRFDQEEPSEPSHLMNHCLGCGAKITDIYTHAEPGSAYYPTSPDECSNISMFLLPVEDDVSVVCGWSSGGLTDWLDYDQAKPWEALTADQFSML
jgi:hypothetical protein